MHKLSMIAQILGLVITLMANLLLSGSAWAGRGLPNNYTTAASVKAIDRPGSETDYNARIETLRMQIQAMQSAVVSQQKTLNTMQSQLHILQRAHPHSK